MGCAYEFDRGGGQHANETGRGSWQGRRAGIQSMASGSLICCRAHPRELLRATQTKERQV